jgi:hypothetical protein
MNSRNVKPDFTNFFIFEIQKAIGKGFIFQEFKIAFAFLYDLTPGLSATQ